MNLFPFEQAPEKARALIAVGISGHSVIVSTDSAWVQCEVENVSDCPIDLGMIGGRDGPDHGIWLWEGELKTVMHQDETDTSYKGTCREVRPDELASLLAMEPPREIDQDEEEL